MIWRWFYIRKMAKCGTTKIIKKKHNIKIKFVRNMLQTDIESNIFKRLNIDCNDIRVIRNILTICWTIINHQQTYVISINAVRKFKY